MFTRAGKPRRFQMKYRKYSECKKEKVLAAVKQNQDFLKTTTFAKERYQNAEY
jgi:hypothetical protein